MAFPKVTVICLCYNQEKFVQASIQSVLSQTYPDIELIVVDDASTDNSRVLIREVITGHPNIRFITLAQNSGNCKAFNSALARATGEYIIDLAADDILMPERVSKGVDVLIKAGNNVGINFTDADWISEGGIHLYRHSDRFPHETIPEGDIYKHLIERFFICSPTMMFSRQVTDSLAGYDEELTYEDFDFWIRSSRNFKYSYTPEVLVKKRVVKNSMSQKQFRMFSSQQKSTFRVCEKILGLNRSKEEQRALTGRILYEITVCLRSLNFLLILDYIRLYFRNRATKYDK